MLGKEPADVVIYLQICNRIGPGGFANRILVYILYTAKQFKVSSKFAECARFISYNIKVSAKGRVEDIRYK